jgi:riboflavin kinase/FMN adenylyltransferase
MANHTIDWQDAPPESCRGGAVAVGNFDGVHLGHAALLAALALQSRTHAGPAVALTFDPHPVELLRPGQTPPALTTTADRARLLQGLGADHVVTFRTVPAMLALSPEEFFQQVVRGHFGARAMVEGPNFGFGRGRAGTVETLGRLCETAGISLTVVHPVLVEGTEVSSSRIRAALQTGDVATAERLLGRPYRLYGKVGVGQRRGATLGFPTANLTELETLVPGNGVYAARAHLGESSWPAAVNVGPNPTFGENGRKVEAHLISFNGNLYDKPLALDFVRRLRDTRPFASVAQLVEQLRQDVDQTLASVGPSV